MLNLVDEYLKLINSIFGQPWLTNPSLNWLANAQVILAWSLVLIQFLMIIAVFFCFVRFFINLILKGGE